MIVIRFLYFIATFVEVAIGSERGSAEADDISLLAKAQNLVESAYVLRGSDLNVRKKTKKKDEETSLNQSAKRMLEAGTNRILQLLSINDDCCDAYEKKFCAPTDDGGFGTSCSISDELVVIGADLNGGNNDKAAYLFNLDGTEIAKLTVDDDGEDHYYDYDYYGISVSMDEKVIVSSKYDYFQVFSRQGIYERTIRCDDCYNFGKRVATLGNLIVTSGYQNSTSKLFIYATDGELLKSFEQELSISDVAISEQFIISTSYDLSWVNKTIIYSNTSPDFPKIAEINPGGSKVAVSDERLVIGNANANDNAGAAGLYNTNGTFITALDRQDASCTAFFGESVAITDEKVIVGAVTDNSQAFWSGSVFLYSAIDGEFIEKVSAPDGKGRERFDLFGDSVCASDSYYMVGATGDDTYNGAAYLFQFSEE